MPAAAQSQPKCAQCADLLRHLHVRNQELARAREDAAEVAQFREQKRREMVEKMHVERVRKGSIIGRSVSPTASASDDGLSLDQRRVACLVQRNADLAGERDALQGRLSKAQAEIDALRAANERLEQELAAEGAARTDDAQLTTSPGATPRDVERSINGRPLNGASLRSTTPDQSFIRRGRTAPSPYIADTCEDSRLPSQLPSQNPTPRQRQRSTHSDAVPTPDSSMRAGTERSTFASRRLRTAKPTAVPAPGVVATRSPRPSRIPSVSPGRAASASPDAQQPQRAASSSQHWVSPNFALLSEEPGIGDRPYFSKRPTANMPRVASLSPGGRQHARDVAAALGWKAARVSGTRDVQRVGPRSVSPRQPPERTLSSPRPGRSASPPQPVSEEVAEKVAELRAAVAHADREQFMALVEIEARSDAAAPFKIAFEAVKQCVAQFGAPAEFRSSLAKSASSVADNDKWPVTPDDIAAMPASQSHGLAKNLKRLVASYDYLRSSGRHRARAEMSSTIREFELNVDVLVAIAQQPSVRPLLITA